MKQKYLQEIRKRMFWRFKGSDIREVLEELDMYFETAEEEGLTQEQFADRYGAPRDLVREMMETQAIPAKEQSRNLLGKFFGMICAVVLMVVSYFCIGVEAATWVGIVFLAMLIWSLSGCNYYLGRSKEVSDRKRAFLISQIGFWSVAILLQIGTLWVIPDLCEKAVEPKVAGKCLYYGIIAVIVIGMALLIPCAWKLFRGKAHQFFIVMELLSLICSVILHLKHLKRMEDISTMAFVCTPCIVTAVVLLCFWVLFFRKEGSLSWMHR